MVGWSYDIFTSLVEQRVTKPRGCKTSRECKGLLLLLHQRQGPFHLVMMS